MHRRRFIQLLASATALLSLPARLLARAKDAFAAVDMEKAYATIYPGRQWQSSERVRIIIDPRIEDGAVVPIRVDATLENPTGISIFVAKNPNPLIAHFHLSPDSNGFIATRIKMEFPSMVTAIVETADGLYGNETFVEVMQGGCASATGDTTQEERGMGKSIRLRTRLRQGTATVRAIIRHPMETGFRIEANTQRLVPTHYVEEVIATHNGKIALRCDWSRAISKNPYLAFEFNGAQVGDIVELAWRDNLGKTDKRETTLS
ncbi:MAG: thiosulfate oxidation carrier complex protein SoxZ [Candidatus Eutrophobiaceae bacterium]